MWKAGWSAISDRFWIVSNKPFRILKIASFAMINFLFTWRYLNVPQNWDTMAPQVTWFIAVAIACVDVYGVISTLFTMSGDPLSGQQTHNTK